MSKYIVLYNPKAGAGSGETSAMKLKEIYPAEELDFRDITIITDYKAIKDELNEDDKLIVCGGDGTLSRFANFVYDLGIENDILYFAKGSGNDFLRDIPDVSADKPFKINEYINDLPVVTVKGKDYRFVNGVGYGIDGYCCQVGDEMREANAKSINYTAIAIKGLLFHYKPTGATVTVDGKVSSHKKVWLAPTMNGGYYGGGMRPCPAQKRDGEDKKVSLMMFAGSGKLKTLMIFPSIFTGEHIKNEKVCQVFAGHEITVKFDRPAPLQIDGETILDVTEYTVKSRVYNIKEEPVTV